VGTHDWGIIATTIGSVLAPLKGGGGAPFPAAPPEPPLPPVPPGTGDAAGAASDAAREATAALGKIATELTTLDATANERLEAIVASGEAGKAELERVEKDVEAKCVELGPRLETPQGQRELQDYVEQRLGQARTVINDAMATADENARKTRELTDRYAGVGQEGNNSGASTTTTPASGGDTSGATTPASGGDTSGATTPASGGDTSGATTPASGGDTSGATTPASGGDTSGGGGKADPTVQQAAAANPFGAGLPMGGGMPMGGMGGIPMGLPSFGGGGGGLGGLPSFGGDPMSALSGLAGSSEPPMGFKDDGLGLPDQGAGGDAGAALTGAEDDSEVGDGEGVGDGNSEVDKVSDVGGEGTGPASATPVAQTGAETADTDAKADGADGGAADAEQEKPAKTTEVALPDGSTTEARSPVGAAAVRAILNGASVSEGYAQQGVTLPPPGTPVTDPVPPAQLKAGDVGVWKDHMVMALGNKNVLVNGQVQPQESVGSGPDFLGWIDPTKLANPSAQV
jgi:hypothetical protein